MIREGHSYIVCDRWSRVGGGLGRGSRQGRDVLNDRTIRQVAKGTRAVLHLNGTGVGDITVTGWDASWTYGHFAPGEAFGQFATIFGRWSLLMHEDEHEPLSHAASEALRDAERLMDTVHARVYFPDEDSWHEVAQLNIDGGLIEWKEF
jgi:hypothetical protein